MLIMMGRYHAKNLNVQWKCKSVSLSKCVLLVHDAYDLCLCDLIIFLSSEKCT